MYINNTLFAILFAASVLLFAVSCYRRIGLVALGRPEARFDHPVRRLGEMLRYAIGQRRVVARPFGLNHLVLFWSFLVLLIANAEFILHGLVPQLSLALLPVSLHHGLAFAFDIVSLLTLLTVAMAVGRRLLFPPPYIEAKSRDAFIILGLIATLMLAFFAGHAAEIALGREAAAAYMPVSSFIASLIAPRSSLLDPLFWFSWWLHAVALLVFMNYLPYSKHLHVLTAIPNCFFKRLGRPNTQPREEFTDGGSFGVGQVDQFSWKELFDSLSCTECGRCQDVCPAAATGKPLIPKDVIHHLKVNLLANGPLLKKGGALAVPLIGDGEGSIAEDAIWSCTTCGACMEVCPVFIEQMPKLVQLRRYLVESKASFPEELLNLFENMEGRSNPWGIAPSERTKWSATLEVQPFEAGKTEYLFYVGCAGAFDSRSKQVTLALAKILDAAGISWGVLGKEEKCCGDSLRRLGNEYVFDKMAEENVKLFRDKGVTKVITQCPHCFSTLQNDYRQYGLELEVIHHSQLINELLQSGRLKLNRQMTELGGLLYHDPCYLGRHNGVYDAPRQVITAATGSAALEMGRHKNNSFCCGAGGGRMWLEEHQGSRINLNRVDEALRKNPDTICVACPYCMTMLEDGLKDRQAGQTRVRDIAELVAEGI